MQLTKAPMRGVPVTLHDAATVGNGIVLAVPDSFKHHQIIIRGATGLAAGAIQPETSQTADFAGTWAPIGGGPIAAVADAEIEYNWIGVYKFIRSRFSTESDEDVTVTYVGS